jgi:hypothetical protein
MKKPKVKEIPPGSFYQTFSTDETVVIRELSFTTPTNAIVLRSSHERDSLTNMRRMTLSVLKELAREKEKK